MIAGEAANNAALLREIRTQLSEDPDTLPVCLSLLDRATEMADRAPRALRLDRPDASRLYRGYRAVAMTAPGGWRVVPIVVDGTGKRCGCFG